MTRVFLLHFHEKCHFAIQAPRPIWQSGFLLSSEFDHADAAAMQCGTKIVTHCTGMVG
jgi:hypothetical protein